MEEDALFDIAVIGAGPAGYSAAINARKREKSVVVIGQNTGWLTRAESIENYPGLPSVSGRELLERMRSQAEDMGAELRGGVVHQVIPMGEHFALSLGADFAEAKKIILCTGAKQPRLLPGEEALLDLLSLERARQKGADALEEAIQAQTEAFLARFLT